MSLDDDNEVGWDWHSSLSLCVGLICIGAVLAAVAVVLEKPAPLAQSLALALLGAWGARRSMRALPTQARLSGSLLGVGLLEFAIAMVLVHDWWFGRPSDRLLGPPLPAVAKEILVAAFAGFAVASAPLVVWWLRLKSASDRR